MNAILWFIFCFYLPMVGVLILFIKQISSEAINRDERLKNHFKLLTMQMGKRLARTIPQVCDHEPWISEGYSVCLECETILPTCTAKELRLIFTK